MKTRRAIHRAVPAAARPLVRKLLPLTVDGAAVVAEARAWVGVPFRHQGRARSGVDCIGLPISILAALGAPFPEDLRDYPRAPQAGDLERYFLRYCSPLPAPVPGCAIALKPQRILSHVAIYTDRDTLVHVLERQQEVVEHGFRGMWRSRFAAGAFALPGVRY